MSVRDSAISMLTDWQAPDADQDALRHAVLAFLHARPDGCTAAASRAMSPRRRSSSSTPAIGAADAASPVRTLAPTRRALRGHDDADIVAAALREATEESGIDGLRMDADLAPFTSTR